MSGEDLQRLRKAAGISGQRVADAAGWSHRARVAQIEAMPEVPTRSAQRYLEALTACVSREAVA